MFMQFANQLLNSSWTARSRLTIISTPTPTSTTRPSSERPGASRGRLRTGHRPSPPPHVHTQLKSSGREDSTTGHRTDHRRQITTTMTTIGLVALRSSTTGVHFQRTLNTTRARRFYTYLLHTQHKNTFFLPQVLPKKDSERIAFYFCFSSWH